MKFVDQWNATLYDDKHAFVSNYGKGILELLAPQMEEDIVDLGCGTGDLTKEISLSGANVIGMDASEDMLQKARDKYPEMSFVQADANSFQLENPCHAVFSNAALHWIKTPEDVIHSVYKALLPSGRFVAEFGGKGNVETVIHGMLDVLTDVYQINEKEAQMRIPWYFPSIGEYSKLLESVGFRVTYAHHFDRPTVLMDGDEGIYHWLDGFAGSIFSEFPGEEKIEMYEKIKRQLQSKLYQHGEWTIDYKRLRIIAVK